MASASSMPPLDQKRELKSLLECPICLETFDDPRTLPCLHSFCTKCLENFVEGKHEADFKCPVCRCKFTLDEEGVVGMNKNHFICNMVEALSLQQHTGIPCSHCEQTSVGRCVTCELFMCESCLQSHNGYVGFKDHEVLRIEELSKPENRKKMKRKSYCKKHSSKKLKLYCETCDELICTYCMSFEHVRPGHVCFPLEEIAERKREELKTLCQTLKCQETHNRQLYNNFALTSFHLHESLKEMKSRVQNRKNRVLAFVNDALEMKAQTLIEEVKNSAILQNQAIDKELKRISDHMAGQKKTYDMTKVLHDAGINEEIMLSQKAIQQSVNKGTTECEIPEMIDDMVEYSDEELDSMFYNEVGNINENKDELQRRIILKKVKKHSESAKFNLVTGKCDNAPRERLRFDEKTKKLCITRNTSSRLDTTVATTLFFHGCSDD